MHVLMITTDHLMIDRRILQQAETLIAAGHRVTLLAGFECPRSESYGQGGVLIHRFAYDWSDTRSDPWVARLHAGLPQAVRAAVSRVSRLGLAAFTGLTSFQHFVLRQVMAQTYDVLHCHDFPLLHVAVEACRRRPVPLVYDAHELYHAQVQLPATTRRRYRRTERRLIRKVQLAMTVNPFIAEIMGKDYGVPAPHVILNAAPRPSRDEGPTGELRRRLGYGAHDRIVLYQGWMSAERGLDRLVQAARHFPSDVHLVLVGYGVHEAELHRLSAEQGTDDGRVVFFGRVEPDVLAVLTRDADLGVIPYHGIDLNNTYCSPNKLFEFAVAGVPFLSNDLPYLRSIADTWGYGMLTDLSSPEQAAQAILSVVRDDARLAQMKAAASKAGETLNWDVEGAKLLDLYERYIWPLVPGASPRSKARAA
jgi:glycosyltransferase involved in cell wall biosynthesis